ncbi:ABC transporter substrate-binding protein [Microbacterium sp. K24]|uniref:ABC transporter substrate-binding protein n=1 Tax=Microbacterium sp. K24 TaxID=2305446 RepID=UPI00197B1904|nr:ABC transporter substrate-binding protein [Microbacterium sp. K24]
MRKQRLGQVAVAGLAGAALLLTGCAGSGGSEGGEGGGDVEVFTWWTSGGEAAGLEGLADTFSQQCEGQTFVNAAIAGGTGSNAKQVLASRMQQNDPPSTFQMHAGAEAADYIKAGQVQDLSEYYSDWGLDDAFPQGLLDALTVDGKIYSVPVNIHRIVLWGNASVLADAGITSAPATVDEFISNLETLRANGIESPIAVGVDWTQTELLESVLLSELGVEDFTALWQKDGDWKDSRVTDALEDYKKILSYSNPDRDSLDWTDAEKRLVAGQSAYQLMGDWEVAEFETDGFTDFTHQAFPGTEDAYQWISDSFVLPVGAKNEEGALCWLETVGSAEGQKAFNTKKGSIPARTDADPADYPEYQQEAIADFASLTPAPSCANGSGCTLGQVSAINSAVGKFSTDGDVDSLQKAIGDATAQYGTD